MTLFVCAGLAPTHLLAASGDIYSLGTLNGGTASYATAINNNGQVTGWSWWSTQSQGVDKHAFRYDWTGPGVGVMRDLGTLGGRDSVGYDINDAGQVAGTSENFAIGGAFLYTGTPGAGGTMYNLGALGGHGSGANGINSLGQIVGSATTSMSPNYPEPHAFVYNGTPGADGHMTDLQISGGATRINDAGQIIANGMRYDPAPNQGGQGTWRSLGTLGGSYVLASSINASGQVAGTSSATGGYHAFRYDGTPGQGGVMHDLGTVRDQPDSWARGINDAGFVAGYGNSPGYSGGLVAALWTPDDSAIDLDAWLDSINPAAGARWRLYDAQDINNSGLITGDGSYIDDQGVYHFGAFVLDASSLVPEPSASNVVLGLASLCLLVRSNHSAWLRNR